MLLKCHSIALLRVFIVQEMWQNLSVIGWAVKALFFLPRNALPFEVAPYFCDESKLM
jgi:hypothetical protein